MRSVRLLVLLLLFSPLVHLGILPAQAQNLPDEAPLVIRGTAEASGNDPLFFRYDNGAWQQLPVGDAYVGRVSPWADFAAIVTMPPGLEAFEGGTARDIALVTFSDGSRIPVAVQPETLSLAGDGSSYTGAITRATPVWSPDGRAFVWTEQDYPAQASARLLLYDLDSGETRVLDDALPFMGMSSDGLPSVFSWDASGIVVYTNDESDFSETLRRYDAETGLEQVVRLPSDEGDGYWFPMFGPLWRVDDQGAPVNASVLAPARGEGYLYELNWETGEVLYITPRLEMLSPTHTETSLRLLWSYYHDFMDPPEALMQLVAPDGTSLVAWDDFIGEDNPWTLNRWVLSPAGDAAAYYQDGQLFLWQDGAFEDIALPEGVRISSLQWGRSVWRFATPYGPEEIG
jgi:hypothetical protein